ncbi:unknown [Prevotella sp. CAG:617]|nr:unknown [Prevotella sp. CAG:617]
MREYIVLLFKIVYIPNMYCCYPTSFHIQILREFDCKGEFQ